MENFNQLDDSGLPPMSDDLGINLIDPRGLARYFRRNQTGWDDIADAVHRCTEESMADLAYCADYVSDKDEIIVFMDWGAVMCRKKIAELLTQLEAVEPIDDASFVLFLMSADPRHRVAARKYRMDQDQNTPWTTYCFDALRPYGTFTALANMAFISDPGLSMAWRNGISDDPCVVFNV
jgi:hypothetical protein